MTFDAFDVVVPFPFTDRATTKRRPALILSGAQRFSRLVGQTMMAKITSAKNSDWPLDFEIQDLNAAGLPSASIVRMKLFTLDEQRLIRKAGESHRSPSSALKFVRDMKLEGIGFFASIKKAAPFSNSVNFSRASP